MRESRMTRNRHVRFGERSRETRSSRGEKVRSAPTLFSPLLSNIYLDKLDHYVEKTLIPAYTRGKRRATNPAYATIKAKYEWKKQQGRREEAKELRKQFQKLCSYDPNDDTYRRLYYVRYADDTLFGFAGPRQEAEAIKQQLGQFLRETLKLEMSQEKTLITHASSEKARFLNYHIVNQQNNTKHAKKRRSANGRIGLLVCKFRNETGDFFENILWMSCLLNPCLSRLLNSANPAHTRKEGNM
jgi:Reverse transcriptase (RNA-dependent DNA polymerase)